MDNEKQEALDAAMNDINRRWGSATVLSLGSREALVVSVASTGLPALDEILGVGGWPRGRVVEVYGPEAGGKSTLALHAIASVQKSGGIAAFIDAEHALDVTYAKALGVNTDALLVSQPDNGEQALEVAESLTRSGAVNLIVVDSVAALVPRAELEGEMGDAHAGLQARLMSQALRKLTAIAGRTGTILLFTNQLRQKTGITFGNGETTTGGNALKFYASVRVDIRRIGALSTTQLDSGLGVPPAGARVRIKVVKNKVASPFRVVDVDLVYGRGFDPGRGLLNHAESKGVIARNGKWFSFGDERLGEIEGAAERLRNEPDLAARVLAACKKEV